MSDYDTYILERSGRQATASQAALGGMAVADEPPALAYIEKALSDAYRKEIDQEENVWRSLPFFAATLALQLAAPFQIIDKLPDPTTILGWLSIGCLAIAGCSTLVSLGFLAASIYPQKFDYVAKQTLLLDYAQATDHNQQINKQRERRRSIGSRLRACDGISGGTTYVHYISVRTEKHPDHAAPQSAIDPSPAHGAGDYPRGPTKQPLGAGSAANACGH